MKGFGANIVDAIVQERTEHGLFEDIYDFCVRMSGVVNRKSMEALVNSGAFDSFGISRSQYFLAGKNGLQYLDDLMSYGQITRQNAEDDAASLFGDAEELKIEKPEPPALTIEPDILEVLQREKDVVGMYLSDHPLKKYEFELENFTNCKMAELGDMIADCDKNRQTAQVALAGLVTSVETKISRNGKPFAKVNVEDFSGIYEFAFFGKDYENFMNYLHEHTAIYIEGEICEKYFLKPEEIAAGKKAPYTFKAKKISLLGNVAEDRLAGFAIEMLANDITPELRHRLVHLVKKSKGNIPLSMIVFDPVTNYIVEFISRKYHITVSADFILQLNELGLKYRVSRKNLSS